MSQSLDRDLLSESKVHIVDFGSQYSSLIVRKLRDLGHLSVLVSLADERKFWESGRRPKLLILSGGPREVKDCDVEDTKLFFQGGDLPILGICFGMHLMGRAAGAILVTEGRSEFGPSLLSWNESYGLGGYKGPFWMSHSHHLEDHEEIFDTIAVNEKGHVAAFKHKQHNHFGFQFHPEVSHSIEGVSLLQTFVQRVCHLHCDWSKSDMKSHCLDILDQYEKAPVLCAFSGGVDSLVAAELVRGHWGESFIQCIYIDHGLQRPQDRRHLEMLKKRFKERLVLVDAQDNFLKKLEGIADPEMKRKIIGRTFIEVFEKKAQEWGKKRGRPFKYLLQGTLYPDVIESSSSGGESSTIKSHHNVGGLPEKMNLSLLEPLRSLFKDEVRIVGRKLGLEDSLIHRHPFPGPGLSVRILGAVTRQALRQAKEADEILFEELHKFNLYRSTWQALAVVLNVKTVGVKGDGRSYEDVICLRLVESSDGMTCSASVMPWDFLFEVSRRITNEVKGVTRVVYDITSKPPGTIEWE
jgi:GMP synthase (glutamine-hydrolysing)